MKIVKRYLVSAIVSLGLITPVSVASAATYSFIAPGNIVTSDIPGISGIVDVFFSGDTSSNTLAVGVFGPDDSSEADDLIIGYNVIDVPALGLTALSPIPGLGGQGPVTITGFLIEDNPDGVVTNVSFSAATIFNGDNPLGKDVSFNVTPGSYAVLAEVPLPAGVFLLGTALLGFGVARRRKAGRV